MYVCTHFVKARQRLNSEFLRIMQGGVLCKNDNVELNINGKQEDKNVDKLYNIVKTPIVALACIDFSNRLKVLFFVRNVKNMHYSA